LIDIRNDVGLMAKSQPQVSDIHLQRSDAVEAGFTLLLRETRTCHCPMCFTSLMILQQRQPRSWQLSI
jgi:hypothetical protein